MRHKTNVITVSHHIPCFIRASFIHISVTMTPQIIDDHPCLHDESPLALSLRPYGLLVLGSLDEATCQSSSNQGIPNLSDGSAPKSLILVGNAGPLFWERFQDERPDKDAPISNPMDVWTRSILTPIAKKMAMEVVFPFEGPPFLPFGSWSHMTGSLFPSPSIPNIHPLFGTWYGLRGAFLSRVPYESASAQTHQSDTSPCVTCEDKPCLQACPVDALNHEYYDFESCLRFISSRESYPCLTHGCRARHACPIGQDYIYEPAQAEFHMGGFLPVLDMISKPKEL